MLETNKQVLKELVKGTMIYKKFYAPWKQYKENKILSRRRSLLAMNGLELLKYFNNIMQEENIPYWLEFGSLLGAYRDHGFIKNDFDFDVGVYLSDARRIYHALSSNGFELIREFHVRGENGLEQTYEYRGVTIDLFYFYTSKNKFICNGFYNPINQRVGKYFDICVSEFIFERFSTSPIEFLGLTVPVPNNTERHIIEVYGNGYKIYDPYFTDGFNKIKYPIEEKIGCGYFLR